MNKSQSVIRCEQLKKSYHDGNMDVQILTGIDLEINQGDKIAFLGVSGSGKSTLLHLLGGLDKPTAGKVFMQGTCWTQMSEKKRCVLRNRSLGFIYQFHHLLPEFSALENIAMPLLLGGESIDFAKEAAHDLLDKIGLANRAEHKPAQLSGGERQRIAIARALVHDPACVLADEPTGNLDQVTAHRVFDLILELNRSRKTALVIVTHDASLAAKMDKIFTIKEGRLIHTLREGIVS